MAPDELRRLDALLTTGLGLARKAPSGRLLLARIADSIELGWIPRPWGDEIAAELEAAGAAAGEPLAFRRGRADPSRRVGNAPAATSSTIWSPTRSP